MPSRLPSFGLLVASAIVLGLLSGCTSNIAPELDVDALASETSDFQSEILEDQVVTAAEYEKALLAHRQCVSDAGAKVSEIYETVNHQLTFDWEVEAATDEELERILAEADLCLPEYFDDVGLVWSEQNVLSPEEKQAIQPKVIECLQQAGLTVPDTATFLEIVEAVSEAQEDDPDSLVRECVTRYPEYFMVSSLEG